MLKIEVDVEKLIVIVYAIAVFFAMVFLAELTVPVVAYVNGMPIAIAMSILYVFAYLAYLAGLVKESKNRGVF